MSLPIIIGDGDSASLLAGVDTTTSVCDVAPLRTGIVACAGSTRCLVGIASRAKVNQTVRSLAMIFRRSAVSLEQVSYCNNPRSKINIRHLSSSNPQRTWRYRSWVHNDHPDHLGEFPTCHPLAEQGVEAREQRREV